MDSSATVSTIPDELTGRVPRKTRLAQNGRLNAAIALMLLGVGVFVAVVKGRESLQQLNTRNALRAGGREASALIVGVDREGRSRTPVVRYSFRVDGQVFAGEAVVPEEFYTSLQASGSLPVLYVPADPAKNHPEGWEWATRLFWDAMIGPLIFMVGGTFSFSMLRAQRRVVAKGVPVVAVVTSCTTAPKSGGFVVGYEFRTDDGTECRGRGWFGSSLETGSKVCVLYLAQKPQRNQPYPSAYYLVAQ